MFVLLFVMMLWVWLLSVFNRTSSEGTVVAHACCALACNSQPASSTTQQQAGRLSAAAVLQAGARIDDTTAVTHSLAACC
jgi:hypothetical protein